jgi:hypothetical protein
MFGTSPTTPLASRNSVSSGRMNGC